MSTAPPIALASWLGGQRLGDDHRLDHRRGQIVELDLAAVGLGRRQGLAVERNVDEVGIDAADDDIAPLALIVGDRQAGQAPHRLGDILVGQLADIIGVERLDRVVGATSWSATRGVRRGGCR